MTAVGNADVEIADASGRGRGSSWHGRDRHGGRSRDHRRDIGTFIDEVNVVQADIGRWLARPLQGRFANSDVSGLSAQSPWGRFVKLGLLASTSRRTCWICRGYYPPPRSGICGHFGRSAIRVHTCPEGIDSSPVGGPVELACHAPYRGHIHRAPDRLRTVCFGPPRPPGSCAAPLPTGTSGRVLEGVVTQLFSGDATLAPPSWATGDGHARLVEAASSSAGDVLSAASQRRRKGASPAPVAHRRPDVTARGSSTLREEPRPCPARPSRPESERRRSN